MGEERKGFSPQVAASTLFHSATNAVLSIRIDDRGTLLKELQGPLRKKYWPLVAKACEYQALFITKYSEKGTLDSAYVNDAKQWFKQFFDNAGISANAAIYSESLVDAMQQAALGPANAIAKATRHRSPAARTIDAGSSDSMFMSSHDHREAISSEQPSVDDIIRRLMSARIPKPEDNEIYQFPRPQRLTYGQFLSGLGEDDRISLGRSVIGLATVLRNGPERQRFVKQDEVAIKLEGILTKTGNTHNLDAQQVARTLSLAIDKMLAVGISGRS